MKLENINNKKKINNEENISVCSEHIILHTTQNNEYYDINVTLFNIHPNHNNHKK